MSKECKDNILLTGDMLTTLSYLPADVCLAVMQAIRGYVKGEEIEITNEYAKGIFNGFKERFDKVKIKYEEKCKQNAENGKRGGLASGKSRSETKRNEANASNPEANPSESNHNDNDNDIIKKEKIKKENGDKSLFDFSLNLSFGSSDAFIKAWQKWEQYRREKKLAKWTESTLVAKAKIFEQWGEAKTIQSIEQSIANGWQGLFEPKGDNPKEPISLEDFRKAYRVSNYNDFNADFCPDMQHHRAVLNADLETLKTKFKSDYDYIVADWTRDFSKLKKAVKEGRDRI